MNLTQWINGKVLQSIASWALTGVGGYLLHTGILDQTQSTQFEGSGVVMVGLVWVIIQGIISHRNAQVTNAVKAADTTVKSAVLNATPTVHKPAVTEALIK